MIVKDFNEMSLGELEVIHYNLGIDFYINDGRIDVKEKSLPQTANQSRDR